MILVDIETKLAVVKAIAAAHRSIENEGGGGTALHRKLRALEDALGANPQQPVSILEAPPQLEYHDQINALLRDVVPEMGDAFDSHDVIRHLSHRHQSRYVALLSASPSETPFQDVHGKIGKQLKALAADLGLTEGVESASPDVFGTHGRCVAYRRRV